MGRPPRSGAAVPAAAPGPVIIDTDTWSEVRARREYRSAIHQTNLELRRRVQGVD